MMPRAAMMAPFGEREAPARRVRADQRLRTVFLKYRERCNEACSVICCGVRMGAAKS